MFRLGAAVLMSDGRKLEFRSENVATQADFDRVVVRHVGVVCARMSLKVPPHWKCVAPFGPAEVIADHRNRDAASLGFGLR